MKKTPFTFALIFSILYMAYPGWAYEEIEVANGGTIQGKAVLTGKMPYPRIYHLILFPNIDMCAEVDTDDEMNRVLDDFKISPDGGLKDVVVTIEHVDAGKPFNKEPINILSENCKFFPDVNVIRQGETFKVDNVDAVMHNSQVYQKERGKILLNIPIPAEEVSEGKITFKKNFKIMQMICGMHEFMQTWGYRVQNPYYFQTEIDGNYKIDNIPPGEYKVTAWHYLMKRHSRKIKIAAGQTINIDFEFNANKVVRPFYETIKSGRIKKDAVYPGTAKGRELGR
ncbi:MAG: carboxypeptidase-like regulatory domain-containing protein [Nitrospinae bacterium]|nr:carboxypeptidase-like regulatory domain-containing protein [Nitrospinota bacterium]MZH06065.1 carboxypeptidase-like regulatory domain-containing protein [Nitrospinota bacterium]MZH14707.1 carboxypeptidase-like regulatory domain-containing protein [Nitrospinota bacterium]